MLPTDIRSAYIHIPFCRHRCPYCNFTVIAGRDELQERFVEAIDRELGWLETPRQVETLFFGGGTPTELNPDLLCKLFDVVQKWLPTAANAEISVEANPEDITTALTDLLADHGVNRLSLGAQSLNDDKLRALGRNHTGEDVVRASERARKRFDNLSLDLIFAAPSESVAEWQQDLQGALRLQPDHISTYGLTYELGTQYWSRLLKQQQSEIDESLQREMYELAIDTLTGQGLQHYEVSNFARPGKTCRHNEVYWTGGNYLAAGPGAARHVDGRRESNHRSTTTYLKRVLAGESPVAEAEELDDEARARERLVFGLRRLVGIQLSEFETQTGHDARQLCGEPLDRYIGHKLLQIEDDRLRLTRSGLLVSDSIWPDFLSE